MVMKWKELDGENGCNLLKSTTLEYNWRDWGKPSNISVRKAGVKIQVRASTWCQCIHIIAITPQWESL